MDLSGQIQEVKIDYFSRKPVITLILEQEVNGIEKFLGKILSIKIGLFKKGRSLDSNAYFHVLCDKLRQKNKVSMAHQKNDLITSYGQIEYLNDGSQVIFKTNVPNDVMIEQEHMHMKFIKFDNGGYWYRQYRGSHTYDTSEMAKLIEGTIAECKEAGIETATPDELERMAQLWEKRKAKEEDLPEIKGQMANVS